MNNNRGVIRPPFNPLCKRRGHRGTAFRSMSPTQIILLFFQIISTISLKAMN